MSFFLRRELPFHLRKKVKLLAHTSIPFWKRVQLIILYEEVQCKVIQTVSKCFKYLPTYLDCLEYKNLFER